MILIFEKLSKLFHLKITGRKTTKTVHQTGIISREKNCRIRIMVFGDSNAYRPENGTDCWPAMLQRISGKTLWVINESCDGRTTRYDKGPCNGLNVFEQKIRHALPLDGIIIALGTNDLKLKYGPPSPAEVVSGIDFLVEIIKQVDSRIQPILLTPSHLGNVTCGDLEGAQNRIPALVAAYHRYVAKNNIPIIDLYSNVNSEVDLEPDCVHLNTQGRRKTAEFLWKNFQEICPIESSG